MYTWAMGLQSTLRDVMPVAFGFGGVERTVWDIVYVMYKGRREWAGESGQRQVHRPHTV